MKKKILKKKKIPKKVKKAPVVPEKVEQFDPSLPESKQRHLR